MMQHSLFSNKLHAGHWAYRAGLVLILVLLLVKNGASQRTAVISFQDARICYQGRISQREDAAELSWSGTSATVRFNGTEVKVLLKDERADNYYQVILDGVPTHTLKPDTLKRWYVLASQVPRGSHTVQLFKLTEWRKGKTWLYGVAISPEGRLLKTKAKKKRLEFYGDSITCGYAVEDSVADSGDSQYQNNYLSYAAITARHFNAAYSCIAKSGIGIQVSWLPQIMPEMYGLRDPTDSASHWSFAAYTPQVVVINLGQNDSWLIKRPEHPEFLRRFGDSPPADSVIVAAYVSFVQRIREHYPRAHIVCVLGNMDITREGSPWPGYVRQAIASLNDRQVHLLIIPYKQTPGHPKVGEQQAMAQELINFLERRIDW